MISAPRLPMAFALAIALAAAPAGAQTLYKCLQADGRTVYQAQKCDEGARETAVQTTPSAPANPGAAARPSFEGQRRFNAPSASAPADTLEGMTGRPRPSAPARPEGNAPPRLSREFTQYIRIASSYESCTEVPGFAARYGSAYRIFQETNAAILASLRADPAASAELARRSAAESTDIRRGLASPQAEQQTRQYCDGMIGSGVEKNQQRPLAR